MKFERDDRDSALPQRRGKRALGQQRNHSRQQPILLGAKSETDERFFRPANRQAGDQEVHSAIRRRDVQIHLLWRRAIAQILRRTHLSS